MKQILSILFCVFIATYTNFAQNSYDENLIRPETRIIAESLLSGNLTGKTVGLGGSSSKDFEKFEQLYKSATTNELIELTNHPRGIIRCYAFWGILYKDTSEVSVHIYRDHLLDTERVPSIFVCRIGQTQVNEFFNIVATQTIDTDINKKFTKSDFDFIHKPLPKSDYKNIRRKALVDSIYEAFVVLAKYKKEQDIEFIKKLFDSKKNIVWGLRSVIYFPDTAFLPILKSMSKRNFKKNWEFEYFYNLYYKVLVQYHSDWIKNKLKKDINNRYLRQFIVVALQRFPESEYSQLKKRKINKELNKITEQDLMRLMYLE